MNLIEKIKFLTANNPLGEGKRATFDYGVIRYLGYRRSRFGLQKIVRKVVGGSRFTFRMKDEPHYLVTGRYGNFGDYLALEECWVEGIYDFARVGLKPDLILDLGGHIGMFSLLANRHFPDVKKICFEPDPENHELLQRNLKANGVTATVHNVALSNTVGTMFLNGFNSVGKFLAETGDTPVKVEKITNLVDFTGVETLLMKCDVEGAEFKILEDCLDRLPRNTFMFIEVHEGESAVFRLDHILKAHGFRVEATHPKGLAIDCVAVRGDFDRADRGPAR